MPCPYCSSQAFEFGTDEAGSQYVRCSACGSYLDDMTDAEAYAYDVANEYDICQNEDHDWVEVLIEGEICSECLRCGVIDC